VLLCGQQCDGCDIDALVKAKLLCLVRAYMGQQDYGCDECNGCDVGVGKSYIITYCVMCGVYCVV
jgi:hypothetical protein